MAVNIIVGNDGANTLSGTGGNDLVYGFNPNGPQGQVSAITATRVASGLDQPLFVVAPPGDPGRLFIVEKGGVIRILDLTTGNLLPAPFMTIPVNESGEQGLLGLAFHPDYAENGLFYVHITNAAGDAEIIRYQISADPNVPNAGSATPVLSIDLPSNASNHRAGWLGFGPDGFLHIAVGDGGSTPQTGQTTNDLLGNILRIDVNGDDFPDDATRNYAIPPGNPFVPTGEDEIYAIGLRNPWRPSFDRDAETFFIADVGNGAWEEVNIGQPGANYGWSNVEGAPPPGSSTTAPIFVYPHNGSGASITGGYVYRGPSEGLQGQYFFADFVRGTVFTLRQNGSTWVATERTGQITPDIGNINNPSSFGEDALGNLYIVDIDGEVFRLTPNVTSADQGDVINGLAGDDRLVGGSGNDTINGGIGADEMSGGLGHDTIVYAPGSGADIVTDFLAGPGSPDRIDLHAFGNLSNLADVLALATQVGTNTVIDFGAGDTLTLYNVEVGDLVAADFVLGVAAVGDVVWQHVDGTVATAAGNLPSVSGSWQIVATGNFDGDADSDILWRHQSGQTVTWEMNGPALVQTHNLPSASNSWRVEGTGDFDGDGDSDILWRHQSSQSVIWQMEDGAFVQTRSLPTVGNSWQIAATGDFDADDDDDILWRHDTGLVVIWEMEAGAYVQNRNLPSIGNSWQISATGDFNNDGDDDILWRHDSGLVVSWEMQGGALAQTRNLPGVASTWSLGGTWDFDSDGDDDILWRHEEDTVVTWAMQGGGLAQVQNFGAVADVWQIRGTGEFDLL